MPADPPNTVDIVVGPENRDADALLPDVKDDGSGIGINYADAYLKPFKKVLADGRKLSCKRRGLELTLTLGEKTGKGLMRRLEHGPDPKNILRRALDEAAADAGVEIRIDEGTIVLVDN